MHEWDGGDSDGRVFTPVGKSFDQREHSSPTGGNVGQRLLTNLYSFSFQLIIISSQDLSTFTAHEVEQVVRRMGGTNTIQIVLIGHMRLRSGVCATRAQLAPLFKRIAD